MCDTVSATAATTVGWREWVALPLLDVGHIKAKVDTGARTSALHVENLELDDDGNTTVARFEVLPRQRHDEERVMASATVADHREVRSSSGAVDLRPVIQTEITIAGTTVLAELTLTNRDEMGFRMLVGREALRPTFLVDPGRSYLGGRPART